MAAAGFAAIAGGASNLVSSLGSTATNAASLAIQKELGEKSLAIQQQGQMLSAVSPYISADAYMKTIGTAITARYNALTAMGVEKSYAMMRSLNPNWGYTLNGNQTMPEVRTPTVGSVSAPVLSPLNLSTNFQSTQSYTINNGQAIDRQSNWGSVRASSWVNNPSSYSRDTTMSGTHGSSIGTVSPFSSVRSSSSSNSSFTVLNWEGYVYNSWPGRTISTQTDPHTTPVTDAGVQATVSSADASVGTRPRTYRFNSSRSSWNPNAFRNPQMAIDLNTPHGGPPARYPR